MTRFFTNENPAAIPKQQFPYQSQHSCEDTLVLAINWWQRAVDDDKYCGLVLADMSTAFGRVRHQALGATLSSIEIRGMALKWFISYLSNRQQQVTTAEGLSFPSPCTRAVPQGSVRGPLLFSLYIRDAPDVFTTDSQLFADDIAFYTANPSLSHVVSTLNNDLDKLDQYLSRKGLLLNPSKTRFMVLRKPCHQLSLTCRGITISCCKQAKYLGVTIDEHLTFAPHVKEVCAKAYGKVSTFKHGRRNLSNMARRLFYLSIVQSTLEFASSAYVHSPSSTLFQKLIVCSHLCMKKMLNLDRLTPTSVVLKHGSLYSLEQRCDYKLIYLVYRCLNSIAIPLLQDIFVVRSTSHRTHAITRGQVYLSLCLPYVSSNYGKRSISFLAAARWNKLLSECRQARSSAEFCTLIKSHLGFAVMRPSLLRVPK